MMVTPVPLAVLLRNNKTIQGQFYAMQFKEIWLRVFT